MNITADALRALTVWLAACWFGILFAGERIRPLRRAARACGPRWALNALATALALGVAAFTVGPVVRAALGWTASRPFGLLRLVPLPAPLAFAAGVLLLDLSFYYWHRLNHVAPLLWRFHNVHHIDPDLDVTTSFRFHAGEIAYSVLFRAVQIGVIGPGAFAFAAYELLFVAGTLFHHSNVRLPLRLERALNVVFVTPRMHGIHHSAIREETNANYSVVFRWWDALHGTLRLGVRQGDIRIGVAGYLRDGDNAAAALLWLPFRPQRDYWTGPGGAPAHTRPGDGGGRALLP